MEVKKYLVDFEFGIWKSDCEFKMADSLVQNLNSDFKSNEFDSNSEFRIKRIETIYEK